MRRDARRLPEPADAVDVGRRETHMRRELICEAAHLAATHRVRLPGERKRRRSWFPDPPCGEVAIEDGVDLVGALRGLVDTLRIQRDDARRIGKHLEKR